MGYKKELWVIGIIAFSFFYVSMQNFNFGVTGMVTGADPSGAGDGSGACVPDHTEITSCPSGCDEGEESCGGGTGGMACAAAGCTVWKLLYQDFRQCGREKIVDLPAMANKANCAYCATNTKSGDMACANTLKDLKKKVKDGHEIESGGSVTWSGGGQVGTMTQNGARVTVHTGPISRAVKGFKNTVWIVARNG
ncbi:MAG: hypothetical protein Q8Q42_04075 [Nanoarchaeota archaeon]|nr:hypothetical protein [Nanoarchaeota archaeon]